MEMSNTFQHNNFFDFCFEGIGKLLINNDQATVLDLGIYSDDIPQIKYHMLSIVINPKKHRNLGSQNLIY